MKRSDLLEVVYRFYPRGLYGGTDEYRSSEEHYRLGEAMRRAVAEYSTWQALLDLLRPRYPLFNHSLDMGGGFLEDGFYKPAYSAHIEIPGYALGFHVCFIGPYYGVHCTGVRGERPAARDLARVIEAIYPGYEPIPPELGNEVVPDVVDFGKTTIYKCLLSDRWGWLSGPWPQTPPPSGPWDHPELLDTDDDAEADPEAEPPLRPIPPEPRPAIPLTAGERSGPQRGT
jgi:hypothetical protein